MTLRNTYFKDYDIDIDYDLEHDVKFCSRLPLRIIEIPPESISPDDTPWLHCVEVTKDKIDANSSLIRIRVITNTHRGVNINIRCSSPLMNLKYRDLRFQVRNSDRVLVTFPELFITASKFDDRELYFTANDFKVYGSEPPKISPTLTI